MNEKIIRKKRSNNFIKIVNVLIIIAFVIVILFMGRIAVFKTVGGEDLIEFQQTRNIKDEVIYAERGNIYDVNGVPVAQTVPTYNMFAILDPEYSKDQDEDEKKLHVVQPEKIAREVSSIIGMNEQDMLDILKKDGFQVEFAPYGNGLTQTQKEAIDALELEGIYFNKHDSRSYPQGAFASHTIGYASYNQEDKQLEGAMGLEALLNEKWLHGVNGYHKYQTNQHGQKIKDAPEVLNPAENGSNVYLTIDSYIQHQIDSKLAEVQAKHNPAWAVIAVADPKTGAILGVGQTPTFDPNTKEITNYTNYFTEAEYEVGSIMKSITFASAIDTDKYDGNKMIQTGSATIDDWTISDWNGSGWGSVKTDLGLFYSSNTIITDLVKNVMTPEEQRDHLKRFGFGQPTGVEVQAEATGTFALNTLSERVTTGYGQGTTATVAQMLQAYNAIANKGNMMQLHLVDRIEDPSGNLQYKHANKVVGTPLSEQSAGHVMSLLTDSVNSPGAYSTRFKMKSGVMAGKTGTANVADTENGGYLSAGDDRHYTYSFAGIAPAEDPQFVIITSISLPQTLPGEATTTATEGLTDNINTYLSMTNRYGSATANPQTDTETGVLRIDAYPNFINKRKEDVLNYMDFVTPESIVFVGNGDVIIDQSIDPDTKYLSTQRLIFRTNSAEIYLPNFTGWSRKDIEKYASFAKIKVSFEGDGYATEQSQAEGTAITDEFGELLIKLNT